MGIHVTSQIFIALGLLSTKETSLASEKQDPPSQMFPLVQICIFKVSCKHIHYICDGFQIFLEFYCFTVDSP